MKKIRTLPLIAMPLALLLLTFLSCKRENIPSIDDYGKTPPGNVHLLASSNSSMTVAWDRVQNAASYTIQLLSSPDSDKPIDEYTTVSKDSYMFTGLDELTGYYVRVRANFNSYQRPVLGEWAYLVHDQEPGRFMPKYGFVDKDFEEPEPEPVAEEELYPNFPEGWEDVIGDRKGSYASTAPEIYKSGEWEMYRTYTTNSGSALLHKIGDFAAMLSPNVEAYVAMGFDLPYGASKLTFVTGSATKTNANDVNNMPITLSVFYSVDEGATWKKIDDILIDDVEKRYMAEYDNLNIQGPVRFKFQKGAGVARPIVDEIAIYYFK